MAVSEPILTKPPAIANPPRLSVGWARIGVAYTFNPKTVIRGGFGIAYGTTVASARAALNSATTPTLANGFDDFRLQNGFPSTYHPVWPVYDPALAFTPGAINATQTGVTDPNSGRPDRTYQWNIAVQRKSPAIWS